MANLKCYIVSGNVQGRSVDLGAVGLIGSRSAAIVSFFDDRDGNMDGSLSFLESYLPGSADGAMVALIGQCAPTNRQLLMRCKDLDVLRQKTFASLASRMIINGFYAAYFNRGIGAIGGLAATKITTSLVKQFFIRKGMEQAVKKGMTMIGARG